ncbi:hypothetical protein FA95DRAFT_392066 [Auriscalpium vulgare]|uniref:Uncharacterized protein n=1 Tax=Auriscalpium vulgare TaxID=40419 RepID=A0ACB8S4N1_9AGAM|nr:hypothetical protein FA95DRAFT_392066 [Auriscalpium vulgare]
MLDFAPGYPVRPCLRSVRDISKHRALRICSPLYNYMQFSGLNLATGLYLIDHVPQSKRRMWTSLPERRKPYSAAGSAAVGIFSRRGERACAVGLGMARPGVRFEAHEFSSVQPQVNLRYTTESADAAHTKWYQALALHVTRQSWLSIGISEHLSFYVATELAVFTTARGGRAARGPHFASS